MFYYYLNLGLTNREAVALTGGGHSIGGADAGATGWNGTFTRGGDAWPTPANDYFKTLVGARAAAVACSGMLSMRRTFRSHVRGP